MTILIRFMNFLNTYFPLLNEKEYVMPVVKMTGSASKKPSLGFSFNPFMTGATSMTNDKLLERGLLYPTWNVFQRLAMTSSFFIIGKPSSSYSQSCSQPPFDLEKNSVQAAPMTPAPTQILDSFFNFHSKFMDGHARTHGSMSPDFILG